MSNSTSLDFIHCANCNNDIPQHNTKPKTFCNVKCNNDHWTFVNKILPNVQDRLIKKALQDQLDNHVPTIILASLVQSHNRELARLNKKENQSTHLVYFYRHLMINLTNIISEKNVNTVKNQVLA